MKQLTSKIGKLSFPVLFLILGLYITFKGLTDSQSSSFIISGISILLMGILTVLIVMEKLKQKIFLYVTYLLVPVSIVLIFLSYRSVQNQVEFDENVAIRNKQIIQRMKDIRSVQVLFKEANKKYAKSFEELIQFCNTGKLPVVKAIGTVPDTMTEVQAIAKGLVVRDTILITAKDTVVRSIFSPIDSLMYIPFSGGEKFFMDAREITQGLTKVPVFEVFAPDEFMYKGLDPQLIYNKNKDADIKGLKLGDITKPITTGNWE